jgi:hypothetical protein
MEQDTSKTMTVVVSIILGVVALLMVAGAIAPILGIGYGFGTDIGQCDTQTPTCH